MAGVTAAVALLIFLIAVLMARRGQKAAYYSVRRGAQRSANQWLSWAFIALLLSGLMFGASILVPDFSLPAALPQASTATASAPLTSVLASPLRTQTPKPSATAKPKPTAAVKPSPQPTPTLTVTPKATAILEPTSALISPTETLVPQTPTATPGPAAPNKRLTLSSIASGIDATGAPVDAATTFTVGVKSIYVFFDFRDVPPNALLRHTWFRNGGSVYYFSQRFPGTSTSGTTFVLWSPAGGFRAGLYEVRVQVGGVQQFVANFEVK